MLSDNYGAHLSDAFHKNISKKINDGSLLLLPLIMAAFFIVFSFSVFFTIFMLIFPYFKP